MPFPCYTTKSLYTVHICPIPQAQSDALFPALFELALIISPSAFSVNGNFSSFLCGSFTILSNNGNMCGENFILQCEGVYPAAFSFSNFEMYSLSFFTYPLLRYAWICFNTYLPPVRLNSTVYRVFVVLLIKL